MKTVFIRYMHQYNISLKSIKAIECPIMQKSVSNSLNAKKNARKKLLHQDRFLIRFKFTKSSKQYKTSKKKLQF